MILTRYLSRLLLARFLTALLALAGIAGLLDIIDNAGTVLDRRGNPEDLLIYLTYRLPSLLISVFPLAVLIAAIFVFAGLAVHQEIVALRAAGVTFARITRSLIPAAALIGAGYWAVWNFGAPPAELALRSWLGAPEAADGAEEKSHWVRLGTGILAFEAISEQGARLSHVTIYEREPHGNLLSWVEAERAIYRAAGSWQLEHVSSASVEGAPKLDRYESMIWKTPLRPGDVLLAAIPASRGALAQPRRTNLLGWIGAKSQAYYETRAHVALAIIVIPFIMVFLAVPVAAAVGRRGELAARLGWGLCAGLAYILVDGILRSLGEAGALPPLVAAWGAPCFFLLAGATVILYIQD